VIVDEIHAVARDSGAATCAIARRLEHLAGRVSSASALGDAEPIET